MLLGALALAGCGGDDGEKPASPARGQSFNAEDDARYTEKQVAKLAGFTTEDGISYAGPSGCQVSVIMVTRGSVETYAGAGDAVVTNPKGDVGVKFFPEPGCRGKLLEALKAVE